MKKAFLKKALLLTLTVFMLVSILPASATGEATNDDWKIDGEYVILSANELVNAASTSGISSAAIEKELGRTYLRYNITEGKREPSIDVTQAKTGVNFADYNYYVFSYVQSGTDSILDTCFSSDVPTSTDYDGTFTQSSYWQWPKVHPSASKGEWTVYLMSREELNGNYADFAPIPTLTNQFFRFKPIGGETAEAGEWFGFEFIAFFKTEAEANAFVEMYTAKKLPAEAISLTVDGTEVSEITIPQNDLVPVSIDVTPAYAASSVDVSFSGDIIEKDGNAYRAVGAGETVMTVTDGSITKNVTITVTESKSYVISAADFSDIISKAGFSATKSIKNDEEALKRVVRFDINSTGDISSEAAKIMIDLTNENINAKEYPHIKIGYRSNLTGNTYVDFVSVVDKYYPNGPTVTQTPVQNWLWGPLPTVSDAEDSAIAVASTDYTGCSAVSSGYNWNHIADDAIWTGIDMKPFRENAAQNTGDYIEIEYIAFFTDTVAMNNYVHEVAESKSHVISAVDFVDSISKAGFSATKSIKNDEEALKRVVRFDINSTGDISSEAAKIMIDLTNENISAKEYPHIKIGYKSNLTGNTYVDFVSVVDKYYPNGPAVTQTPVQNWLWGPLPAVSDAEDSAIAVASTDYTGCSAVSSGYSWNHIADDAIWTGIDLKPFRENEVQNAGDYIEIEYIAFFTDAAAMNSYVHDSSLKDLYVEPTMTLAVGEYKTLPITITPASAYVKVNYSSNDESVAKVTSSGTVIALKEGTATITATTADGAYSADCVVTVEAQTDYSRYIFDRDDLENLKYRLNENKELNIVYLGGSVTQGSGASAAAVTSWRALIGTWFEDMFPEANITNINSALGGSGSMHGAFRLKDDVIAHDPDLVFVEFAVNDTYCDTMNDGTVAMYYEYILRTLREELPETEIISLYVSDSSELGSEVSDALRETAVIHDEIAEKYGVTGISVGRAMCNTIIETGAEWRDYVADTVHPADAGHRLYADVIEQYLFDKLLADSTVPTGLKSHTCPADYYDSRTESFVPEYVKITEDTSSIFNEIKGWTYSPESVFSHIDSSAGYIYPSEADNSFTYEFYGTAIALFYEYGEGKETDYIEFSIDGGEPTKFIPTNTAYPFNQIIKGGTDAALDYGKHTLTFSYKGPDGNGAADSTVKLMYILVTGSEAATTYDLTVNAIGNGSVSVGEATSKTYTDTLTENSTVTLTAVPDATYQVDGWYDVTDGKNVLLAKETDTYVHTAAEDMVIEVRFMSETIKVATKLSVSVGAGEGTIEVGGNAYEDYTDYANGGDTVEVTAKPNDGYTVAYWTRVSGAVETYIGTNETISVSPLGTSVIYKPVFIEAGTTVNLYVDAKGVIIATGEEPAVPDRIGYTGGKWLLDEESASVNVYVADYVKSDETYTLTVNYADGTSEEKSFKYNQLITLTATAEDTQWVLNGTVVSNASEYSFYITFIEDVVIEEVAGSEAEAVLAVTNTVYDAGSKKIKFMVSFELVEGMEFVETGVLLSNNADIADTMEIGDEGVITGKSSAANASAGNYIINKGGVSVGDTWYGRAYLICKQNGETTVIYADTVSHTAE